MNPTNLADMWEEVIEGKSKPKSAKHAEKRQKIAKVGEGKGTADDGPEAQDGNTSVAKEDEEGQAELKKAKKKDKKEKRRKRRLHSTNLRSHRPHPQNPQPNPLHRLPNPHRPSLPPSKHAPKAHLPPRFRHLNQTLYTTPSAHSLELFSRTQKCSQNITKDSADKSKYGPRTQ